MRYLSKLICTYWMAFLLAGCTMFSSDPGSIPFSKGAYTVGYEETSTLDGTTEKTRYKLSSDGQGHKIFFDDTATGAEGQCLDDHLTGRSYCLNRKEKTAIWRLLKNSGKWHYDEEWLKAISSVDELKSAGESTIDGHECRGYIWDLRCKPPNITEYWFDKVTGCLVAAKAHNAQGGSTTTLTSYSKKPLPAASFVIPLGYKIMPDPIFSRTNYP